MSEKFVCPDSYSRIIDNTVSPPKRHMDGPRGAHWDTWNKRNGVRVCSYCGSVHPEDVAKNIAEGGTFGVTTKYYKLYLDYHHMKVYSWHFDEEVWHGYKLKATNDYNKWAEEYERLIKEGVDVSEAYTQAKNIL